MDEKESRNQLEDFIGCLISYHPLRARSLYSSERSVAYRGGMGEDNDGRRKERLKKMIH